MIEEKEDDDDENLITGYGGLPLERQLLSVPSLDKAINFYRENILPRRKRYDKNERNEFGESSENTELYPILGTSSTELNAFGLGVAMYFQTLQLLIGGFILLALFQTHALLYFEGPLYSDNHKGTDAHGKELPFLLRGSAVCTRQEMVCLDAACETLAEINKCKIGEIQLKLDFSMTIIMLLFTVVLSFVQDSLANRLDERVQTAQDYSIIVNDPTADVVDPDKWEAFFRQFGHVTFVTVAVDNGKLLKAMLQRRAIMRQILLYIGNGRPVATAPTAYGKKGRISALEWDQGLSFREKIDKDIVIFDNPIPHPQKTRSRSWTKKKSVVDLDLPIDLEDSTRAEAIDKLHQTASKSTEEEVGKKRGHWLKQRSTVDELVLPSGSEELDELGRKPFANGTGVGGFLKRKGFFGMKALRDWKKQLRVVNRQINAEINRLTSAEGDSGPRPHAKRVFVTFESEYSQRRCLGALSIGIIPAMFNTCHDKTEAFEGKNILDVNEAPEADAIIWTDCGVTQVQSLAQQTVTMIFTLSAVCGSVLLTTHLNVTFVAIWIALTNILFPQVLRRVCLVVEKHISRDEQQESLFIKMSIFRWLNSAIVLYLITEYENTLTVLSMKRIMGVLVADCFTAPLIRTLNIGGKLKGWWVCRYVDTQGQMNSFWLGKSWRLGERYADMTKTLFLALFFSALIPASLFFTVLSFTVSFWTDKYLLLRVWRTPALIDGRRIMKMVQFQLYLAVYIHAVMTLVFLANFPFDGICESKKTDAYSSEDAILPTDVFQKAHTDHGVEASIIYHECDQMSSWRASIGRILALLFGRDLEESYMYGKQKRAVRMHSRLVTCMSTLMLIVILITFLRRALRVFFLGTYIEAERGHPIGRPYSKEGQIQAYIPTIQHSRLDIPLIAAPLETKNDDGKTLFDPKYLTFTLASNEAYFAQSLASEDELEHLDYDTRLSLFSRVKYYPPPSDLSDERTNPNEIDEVNDSATNKPLLVSRKNNGGKLNVKKAKKGAWYRRVATEDDGDLELV